MELRSMQSWCRCRWWQCVYALWLEFTHHVLSACVHLSISVCEWNHLGVLLSLWDPHLIAKIPSNPRSIPYRSSNSVPTILWDSDTMLTKPPNSKQPPRPPTHYHHSLRMLSCWDPHPISEILSDPRSTPYCSSNSIPIILQESDTMLTKTPNSEYPLNPLTYYYRSPNSKWPWRTPITFLSSFVFIIPF